MTPTYQAQTLNTGDCIDIDYINRLFENQRYLEQCSKTNSEQFTCKRINDTQTGPISKSSTELCFDIQKQSASINPSSGNQLETKMLLFNIRSSSDRNFSDSENPGSVRTERSTRVVCNGETVQTLTSQQTGTSIICVEFECPSNSDVQICFDSKIVTSGQTTAASGIQTIQLCGALVCIADITNSGVTGFFSPPVLSPDCCIGREAIHLAIQNTSALRNTFAAFGQIPSCQALTFNDANDHVLLNTALTDTEFLIIGSLKITGRNTSTVSTATITGKPAFTCGSQRYECLSSEVTIATAEDGVRGGFVNVPVVMCGTCKAGDTLTATIRSQFICSETPSQVVGGIGGGIVSVEQHYCVYLFSKVASDFGDGLAGSIGKCIPIDTMTAINENLEALKQVCDSQRSINVTTRAVSGVASRDDCVVIKNAIPWPPITVPPTTGPAPVKKWYLQGTVYPCVGPRGGLNTEEISAVIATADIDCGGTVLLSDRSTWRVAGSGAFNRCGFPMSFSRCIECPIDEDISVCFTGQRTVGLVSAPDEFRYDFKLFCF